MHLALFDELFTFFSPKSLAHLDADDTKFNECFWWQIFMPVVFAKFIKKLLLRIWHFLIISCLISVRNPWRITSSFWTRMTPSSTSIFGGGISMPVVFATIRRCVMSVKNCIAPTKKPKSTRQGHSILQVYILRPGGTYSSGDMPMKWA